MKKSIYSALPLKEKLIGKIMIYYQTIWAEKRFTATNHKLWLSNFKEDEKINSLYLLSKFMFFGSDEIRELLISIYRDKFKYRVTEKFRLSNSDTTDLSLINAHFQNELDNTRFVSVGTASESGGHILMIFRQVNKLFTRHMKSSSELITAGALSEPSVKHYIFIDDFCGSGETAVGCKALIDELKRLNSSIKVSYYVLFATSEGFENVRKYSPFDESESSFILDNTFKCFNDKSRYFEESYPEIDKAKAKKFSSDYGLPLVIDTPVEGHPLGFNDGQLLISFAHNTPDNTLPIIWGEKSWKPIFVRYIKLK